VLLKIDTERHTNGAKVALKLRGTDQGGIPWIVITDSAGKPLINGDRPSDQGPSNIGCPVSPEERAWFMNMISTTRQHMSDDLLQSIESELAAFAQSMGR
jgi:hypothetical protein